MCVNSNSRRGGFTLLEALVVIALFGLLMAILVPAVQSARSSSRRIQCVSNLHQMGIAAHNYELSYGVFPGAALLAGGQWQQQLAPFLEQSGAVRNNPIYQCPSDEAGSYMVNDGLWPRDSLGYAKVALRRYVRSADITDGLSNTAAFADKLGWPEAIADADLPQDAFEQYWIRRMRKTTTFISDMDAFADECRDNALAPSRAWHVVWGYNHVLAPNQNSCFNGPATGLEHMDYWGVTATSAHSGGVNVLYADGSVRFASDNVDRTAWRAIGTRNGGEALNSSGL